MTPNAPNGVAAAAFVLSLVAGLLIVTAGSMMVAFLPTGATNGMMGGFYPMMNGYYGMMRGFEASSWFYSLAGVGVIAGAIVLVGAVMMYERPNDIKTWGLVVLVSSLLSLFGMGGFFIGAILGIVGGALAFAAQKGRGGV